jgi:hypothetical protein
MLDYRCLFDGCDDDARRKSKAHVGKKQKAIHLLRFPCSATVTATFKTSEETQCDNYDDKLPADKLHDARTLK